MNKRFSQIDRSRPLLLNFHPTQVRLGGSKLITGQVPKKEEAYEEV